MKRNLPYQRIDKAIIQAFIHLSQTIPFEKITVQDILDEALVSRFTFYSHFHDKYEVAERIQDELYQDFLSVVRDSIPGIDARSLSIAEHHRLVDEAIAAFSRTNMHKLHSIINIHTETIDFQNKIRRYLSDNYLKQAPKGKHPELEAMIYSGMALASMSYFEQHDATGISEAVSESYLYAALYAIGIHDRKRAGKAAAYILDIAHGS
jgi:AcrR family transcriptional regulator